MDFAIIAAGEGSRLAKSGYPYPKPLARLQGVPLLDRLTAIFTKYSANSVNIIINQESDMLKEHLDSLSSTFPLRLIIKSTESSLHSFHELLKGIPKVQELCVTTVDTIFREEEFDSYLKYFQRHTTLDALMGVTPFVEDESPLYVKVDTDGNVTAFEDKNTNGAEILVSGGIYALRKKALDCVEKAINSNIVRMRNYQRSLLEENLEVKAFTFEKIIDIDHLTDLTSAEKWLSEMNVSQ
ncbi:nucleotidyltransferase family protein [Olivibacter domesticus]|uniref:MobA-like NTP transferase domain-containing protein n=1 Tax=Olivibacter domesticus TaxID=407022 RepID=A0A1H7QUA0_OLID1|nr:NDP-sugar synthase [Olivibacter domesticus]SEL51536.1 MobA-like NTP transferase domain-containing protein [Olivibacter domesticus]